MREELPLRDTATDSNLWTAQRGYTLKVRHRDPPYHSAGSRLPERKVARSVSPAVGKRQKAVGSASWVVSHEWVMGSDQCVVIGE